VIKSVEVGGIEMVILNDGTLFLTGRSLAKVCGVSNSTIVEWTNNNPGKGDRSRDRKLAEILTRRGFESDHLFVRARYKRRWITAFPEAVCMSFLEYYASHADGRCTKEAKANYRVLSRRSLRDFMEGVK
jgi:transcriptional regulator with XRE-family HTH domain